MSRYALAVSKAGVNTATTHYVSLWTPTNTVFVLEIGISVTTAPTTAPDFYIVRSTARGTQSTTANGSAISPQPAPASVGVVDSAWSVAATNNAATTAIRRIGLPVTAGSGVIWSFERGELVLGNGTGLAIINANASGATLGAFSFYFDWVE